MSTTHSLLLVDDEPAVLFTLQVVLHDEMDRRAIACFDLALADVGLAKDDVLRQVRHDYFAWATTTTISRYHQSADDVPNGLTIPRWSWDGLQR